MHAYNWILFNHESPLRGETFFSRKITRAVARISQGRQDCLYQGNFDARRDWGHARDYVDGMWRILQHLDPEDFVHATGLNTNVRAFTEKAFSIAGLSIQWEGTGESEIGRDPQSGAIRVRIDPQYYRPTEVDLLLGDATKAQEKLDWNPKYTLDQLI